MSFEGWLQTVKHIDIKTFQLRGYEVQKEIYTEYNEAPKSLEHD